MKVDVRRLADVDRDGEAAGLPALEQQWAAELGGYYIDPSDWWSHVVERSGGHLVGAFTAHDSLTGQLCGVAYVAKDMEARGLIDVYVPPAERRKGYGLALHETAVRWSVHQGLRELRARSMNWTAARPFLERVGAVRQPTTDDVLGFELTSAMVNNEVVHSWSRFASPVGITVARLTGNHADLDWTLLVPLHDELLELLERFALGFVARDPSGRVVGVSLSDRESGPNYYVSLTAVEPGSRRTGIALALKAATLRYLHTSEDSWRVRTDFVRRNIAIRRTNERLGFRQVSESLDWKIPPPPSGEVQRAVH